MITWSPFTTISSGEDWLAVFAPTCCSARMVLRPDTFTVASSTPEMRTFRSDHLVAVHHNLERRGLIGRVRADLLQRTDGLAARHLHGGVIHAGDADIPI